MRDIFIPATGMAPDDVTLELWLKEPGDHVEAGEVVAVVETSKATLEVESDADGVLDEHLVQAQESVAPGTTIVRVIEAGDPHLAGAQRPAPSAALAASGTAADAVRSAQVVDGAIGPGAEDFGAANSVAAHPGNDVSSTGEGKGAEQRGLERAGEAGTTPSPHRSSPRARRLAAERAAGADTQPASGQQATDQSAAPALADATPARSRQASAPPGPPSTYGKGNHRAAVAAAVTRSWHEIPHFAVTRELRLGRFQTAYHRLRAVLPQVTVTDLLLRALALSFVARESRTDLDIGLAVATDRGVTIPVVRDVPQLDLVELVAARRAAVDRARAGRAHADDGRIPVTTLSNLGALGVDQFTGIVPLGQSSLLTVGRMAPRPVVHKDRIRAAVTMYATLNVDHRSWDGQHAGELLDRLAAVTAGPELLVGFGRLTSNS